VDQKVLETLEFHKIRERLAEWATSSLGREMALSLEPSTDFEEVKHLQEETDEAAQVLRLYGNIPLGGIFNILPAIKRAEIGAMLHPEEFVEISSTIRAGRVLKNFFANVLEKNNFPILENIIENMNPPVDLERTINDAISDQGEVLDSASDKLRSLRQQIRRNEARVREKLESLIRTHSVQKMLSDAIITIRNDRFVIPVKQEYRAHFGGMVHDQSSSGQTLFIEPAGVIELNNELHNAKMEEQAEIERILLHLSKITGEYQEDLRQLVYSLRQMDFIFAKAKFAQSLKASKPAINNKGIIRLFKARHPLIPREEVVPNDIMLGQDYTAIVITGPNTGGKTVTLKTVGLITLMAQAGLAIPAQDGSEVSAFTSIFADIGDEQSIEQSLSTFSSHMVNIVQILKRVDDQSLVLFDELGAGTDPQEGAALAMAILDEVVGRGARVIATTHYPELKAYGYNRRGVTNASVEFDVETLSPTYKLLIGVPGRSNAFDISKRLGLPDYIIEEARSHIHRDTKTVDNMIASLEESRRLAEKEELEARAYLKEAEALLLDLKRAMAEYYEKKDQLMEKAREKAQAIIDHAKEEAEEIIKTLRRMKLEKGAEIKEHELIEAKKRLRDAVPEQSQETRPQFHRKTAKKLSPGDEVKVLTIGQNGHLVEKASDEEWFVQIGILKMKIAEKDLELIESKPETPKRQVALVRGKDFHVSLECDLRGERYEEALIKLEKYIDDALLAGYPRVSVIHGKGTGALRTGVTEYLKRHRAVKSIRFGDANEGGTGVTIVEFK